VGIADVEALELPGSPARDVQRAVVDRQGDVGDQRRHRAERLEGRRQLVLLGRLGRDRDDLARRHCAVGVGMPQPDRRCQVGGRDDDADEAVGLGRVVRGAQLEHHLVLGAKVDRLLVAALLEVPDVELVAVLAAQQQLGDDPALDHVGKAPLAREQLVVADVPPDVVGELLRTSVDLPPAEDVERVVVEQEDPARTFAVGSAQRRHVEPVGAAVDRVRTAVTGAPGDLLGLDDLDELRLRGVVLDVDHVEPRRAQAGHEEVAALHMRVGRPRAQRRRAGVPAEVVQLVADVRHVQPADGRAVRRRAGLQVDDGQRVGPRVAIGARVERDDVGKLLGRRLRRQTGRGVERRMRPPPGHRHAPLGCGTIRI
jgi:hypothetical protein